MWIGGVNLLLVGYFVSLLVGLFWIIQRSVKHAAASPSQRLIFILLGLLSLTLAWYNIGMFIVEDYYERHSPDPAVRPKENRFVRAYKEVAETPLQWLWSSSLLSFVPSMIAFTVLESYRHGIKDTVVYIWVGFFGAISGAFPMFLLRLKSVAHPAPGQLLARTPQLSLATAFSCILGLLSVAATPYTLNNNILFILNLAFMHVILLVPMANSMGSEKAGIQRSPAWIGLFMVLAGIALATRLQNLASVFANSTLDQLFQAISANYCQLSITGDLIFCVILSIIYFYDNSHANAFGPFWKDTIVVPLLILLPFVSVSVVFPVFLALREIHFMHQVLPKSSTYKLE